MELRLKSLLNCPGNTDCISDINDGNTLEKEIDPRLNNSDFHEHLVVKMLFDDSFEFDNFLKRTKKREVF